MVYFQTKNTNLGKFGGPFKLEMVVYFMTIWNILRPIGIIYGIVCGHFVMWSFGN
jgi:hypothetical protein